MVVSAQDFHLKIEGLGVRFLVSACIVLFPWTRNISSLSLSAQVYKWVPMNRQVYLTKLLEGTLWWKASHLGGGGGGGRAE